MSEPEKRGYMKRMHKLWCDIRPQYKDVTEQYLRNQVAALKKRGFTLEQHEETGRQEVTDNNEENTNGNNQDQERHRKEELKQKFLINLNKFEHTDRLRTIHFKQNIRTRDLRYMNEIIRESLPPDPALEELGLVVYAAAVTLTTKALEKDRIAKLKDRIHKIKQKVTEWRRKASRVQSLIEHVQAKKKFTTKIRRIAKEIKSKHNNIRKGTLNTIKELAIDKLRSLVAVRKCLEKRLKKFEHNYKFKTKPSSLFRELSTDSAEMPTMETMENFWKDIYEKQSHGNQDKHSLKCLQKYHQQNKQDQDINIEITEKDVKTAFKGKPNYSAPGPDSINTFWWKKFDTTHRHVATHFNRMLSGETKIPDWMCEGRTVLIFKKGDPKLPDNYRPITCLNTIYKAFTSLIMEKLLKEIDPIWKKIYEQRGSKRGVPGLKDNILIDSSVCQDANTYKRNLSMAWIDYRKAYDSTSHEWITLLLRTLKVNPLIVNTIIQLFTKWRIKLVTGRGRNIQTSRPIQYRRGVIQGDSLSPLLFCISLIPLTLELRGSPGYSAGPPSQRKYKITHLFYVDDLKIYAQSPRDLQSMIQKVERFSTNIGMQFGLQKCATTHLKKGRPSENQEEIELVDGTAITQLAHDQTYTYLGIPQKQMNELPKIKQQLTKQYLNKVKKIWTTELNAKNKCQATNSLALPLVSHTFGSIRWTVEEITDLDRKTRKELTKARSLHPNASTQRVYLPRQLGGRGIIAAEDAHSKAVITTAHRIIHTSDPLLEIVKQHEINGRGSFLFKAAERAAQRYGLMFNIDGKKTNHRDNLVKAETEEIRPRIIEATRKKLQQQHMQKNLHSVFYKNINDQHLSTSLTFGFLTSPGLYSETEGFIMACQDGVFPSLQYRKQIMGAPITDTRCRACKTSNETTMHLLSACPKYAKNQYILRHNNALKVVYYHLRQAYGFDDRLKQPYEEDDVDTVTTDGKIKLLWDFPFATTNQIQANRPDMVVVDQERKKMTIVEMSCPGEKNITEKEIEKQQKYADLMFELRKTYPGYRIKFIPLIIGVLGGMMDNFTQQLEHIGIPRDKSRHIALTMQKYVILGSLRILRFHEASHPPT